MTPAAYRPLSWRASRSATRAPRAAISVTPNRRDRLPLRVPTTRAKIDGAEVPEGIVAVVDARPDGPTRHLRQGVVDCPPRPLPILVSHHGRRLPLEPPGDAPGPSSPRSRPPQGAENLRGHFEDQDRHRQFALRVIAVADDESEVGLAPAGDLAHEVGMSGHRRADLGQCRGPEATGPRRCDLAASVRRDQGWS